MRQTLTDGPCRSFDYFFNTPADVSAAPSAAGFDAFFRGAYAYHYHNEW